MARLKAASVEMGGENWGDSSRESSRGPRVHDRRSSASVMVAREYSMAGLQHVRQQLLDERAAIDLALAEAGDASTQQYEASRFSWSVGKHAWSPQVALVAEQRFRVLGGLQLLKLARQIERDRKLYKPPPPDPPLRLVAYQRW